MPLLAVTLGVAHECRGDGPAVVKARDLLRKLHAELSSIDASRAPAFERRALRYLLDHLAAGFTPTFEVRGNA